MVVIFLSATLEIGVLQERAASPLMCTVHAPQRAIPQPNLVPVIFSVSRSTQRRGICGSTSTVLLSPFSVKVTAMAASLRQRRYRTPTALIDGKGRKVVARIRKFRRHLELAEVIALRIELRSNPTYEKGGVVGPPKGLSQRVT